MSRHRATAGRFAFALHNFAFGQEGAVLDKKLHVLSAGAAKAVVLGIAQTEGVSLQAEFGAVGAMQDQLLAGAPCDVLVLTRAMLDALAAKGMIVAGSVADLGKVHTGIGLPAAALEGRSTPAIADAAALRTLLGASSALYVPDLAKSTAGQHVARMLEGLGLRAALEGRLREFPNGATAMRAMADAGDPAAVGCTQESEIRYTPGVSFVARLPAPYELSTGYAAGVPAAAPDPESARRFAAALTGASTSERRAKAGFEVPQGR